MTVYKNLNATAKTGINFIRGIVEKANCIFHKIEQENDIGVDCIIEIIQNEIPANKLFAIQVKSGNSFFNPQSQECKIPIEKHRDYWTKHPLPVLGVVYVPAQNKAYWTDIKHYLHAYPDDVAVRYAATKVNLLCEETFLSVCVPLLQNKIPETPFIQAAQWFNSEVQSEFLLGMDVLFRKYPNNLETWDYFIDYFRKTPAKNIPGVLVYYLAHVPWHPDIFGFGEQITKETRDHIRIKYFQKFELDEIIKFLSFVDEENMIKRGAIGQSVEAIISSLPNSGQMLKEILKNKEIPRFPREAAALIYAIQQPIEAVKYMQDLSKEGSQYMEELASYIHENGYFNPY